MRIVRFQRDGGTASYGILETDSRILPIEGDVFGRWKRSGQRIERESVRLLVPVQPSNVLAIGRNYRDHAAESSQRIPTEPILFLKASTAVVGSEQPIVLPAMAPDEVDYEAELVIVIGRVARNVTEDQALDCVLGYTCGNDVSARDCQLRIDHQWARAKSFDTFAPLGPWIETELDPDACTILCRLNGKTMQNSNTKNLIFNCRKLVSYLSRCMTLLPGTVIMTGTPAGVGFARKPPVFLRSGDTVEVEIEGIGILRNPVVREGEVRPDSAILR
jgi:2-keto-4-pentenoate hydratase/2-oxohepta-3-ene-1,7-dioic acid hydratase in catechol pathway